MDSNGISPDDLIEKSSSDDIDVVITWVDGSDPEHARRRALAASTGPITAHSGDIRRWQDNDEISILLASLARNARWVRRIWIVTDRQTPPLTSVNRSFAERISIVDLTTIFRGYESLLPTFNSLSIEMMLWRIPGLAEQFVYFNDDMFLSRRTRPEDFFIDGKPVLRGRMVDFSITPQSQYWMNKENAARAAGMIGSYFSDAHVAISMKRSVLRKHFDANPEQLLLHAGPKFREDWQLGATYLHSNICVRDGHYAKPRRRDWHTLSVRRCVYDSATVIQSALRVYRDRKRVKLGCINDVEAASQKVPRLIDTLEHYLRLRYPKLHLLRTAPARLLRLWRTARLKLRKA